MYDDDPIKQEVFFNQGKMDIRTWQPSRDDILERNKSIQNERVIRKTDGIRLGLIIPSLDFIQLTQANPELISHDANIKRRAWHAFIRSAESAPYRVGYA